MNKEDLKKLGLTDEAVMDQIIVLHGKDIEKHKTDTGAAKTEADGLRAQLAEANKQIESFKGMDIDGVKKSADEWKAKAEQAASDAQKQVAQLKFDHALDGALTGAKAKNPKAVRALLNLEGLKMNEADGSILGLKEQLETIQKENDYLFEAAEETPRIVTRGDHQSILTDTFTAAMRKGAGLPEGK